MTRVLLLLAALLAQAAPAGDVTADAVAPTQQQLTGLLSGNTLEGTWSGRPFIQYFAPTGSTRYRELDGVETEGRWRVNENGQYCSVWPPSDRWVCYQVRVSSQNIYWVSGDELYPSEIKPGKLF